MQISSAPELLKPSLLIRASSSSSLKTLGLGLPNWGFGVIVPTSTKPNPRLNRGLYTSAFLSNPAATPIGEGNIFSKKVVSKIWLSSGLLYEILFSFKALIAKEWATSGLNLKINGLRILNIF